LAGYATFFYLAFVAAPRHPWRGEFTVLYVILNYFYYLLGF
jgi:hypothetical protein